MNKPDYSGKGTLNLISSVSKAIGINSKYKESNFIKSKDIKKYKNIILLIVDGLGYNFLMRYGKDSIFNNHLEAKMTTTFPSSTSAAMTSFYTGISPQEHGMPGWEMYSKEFSTTILPLPYCPKFKWGINLNEIKKLQEVFTLPSITEKSKINSEFIIGDHLIDSDISKLMSKKRKGYNTINGLFMQIKKSINSSNRRKFIFSYYSDHDSLSHKYGTNHKNVLSNFNEFSNKLNKFITSLKGTNTILIITADHGQSDVKVSNRIWLKNHPKMKDCLSMPLTGEHRFAYCYIKPNKEKEFVEYVKTKLKRYCTIHKSKDLLKKNYFGLFKPHNDFKDRIGDYVLIMKDGYGIYDQRFNTRAPHKGDHGGLSDDELYVPLIVIKK